jgi:hypothetical protein
LDSHDENLGNQFEFSSSVAFTRDLRRPRIARGSVIGRERTRRLSRHVQRDNLIFEVRDRGVQRIMTEPRTFLGREETAALLWHRDHDRRSVSRCATCNGRRDLLAADRSAGFCGGCLDRSRNIDDDDIGGES